MVPERQQLLAELDRLDGAERLHRVASVARDGQDDPALDVLIGALEKGDASERLLAVHAAEVAERWQVLRRGLVPPKAGERNTVCSSLVARRATAFGRVAGAAALRQLLPDLAPDVRRLLLIRVAASRRPGVADALLPFLLERFGARDAARVLVAASEDVVRRHLPELAHAVFGWRRLATIHVGPVLDFVRRLAPASRLWQRLTEAVPPLAAAKPAAIVDLARAHFADGQDGYMFEACFSMLARRVPERLAALLLDDVYRPRLLREGLPRPVLGGLRHLPPAAWGELARRLVEKPGHLARLLAALPPGERGAVFARATDGVDTSRRRWPDDLLETLPHAVRDVEAARILGLREVAENRRTTLAVTAFRDVDAARPIFAEAARAPKAKDRARALSLLVRCTGRSRHGLGETLAALRLRNEQDSVRQTVYDALSRIPPSLFTAEHKAALETLVDDAVAARDTSPSSLGYLGELVARFLSRPRGDQLFALGLDLLARLGEAGSGGFLLPEDLPRGAAEEILAKLTPQLERSLARGEPAPVLELALALARRAYGLQGLHDLLEQVLLKAESWQARQVVGLWLADREHRDERVRRLLDHDETAVTFDLVFGHLHRRRQTWLDPFLEGRVLEGAFSDDQQAFIPGLHGCAVSHGFHRWPPQPQRRLHQLLLDAAGDEGREPRERAQALRILGRLPCARFADLAPFLKPKGAGEDAGEDDDTPKAGRDVARAWLFQAALGAVGWLDRAGEGHEAVRELLGSEGAGAAISVLARWARQLPPAESEEILAGVLAGDGVKLSVRKEAARRLGGWPRGFKRLGATWDAGLHRDLRIAYGHAARRRLDVEGAWEILGVLARDDEAAVAHSLLDADPDAVALAARPRYADLLLRVAGHADPELRRDAFNALAGWTEGAEEPILAAAARAVSDLAESVAWEGALQAMLAACRGAGPSVALATVVSDLRAAPVPPEHDAGEEDDLPARRRLRRLCDRLVKLEDEELERLRPSLEAIAAELAGDVDTWLDGARLALALIDWRRPQAAASLAAIAAGAEPFFFARLSDEAKQALQRAAARWQSADAEKLLAELDGAGSVGCRHLELAVLEAAAGRAEWVEPWTSRLRALRRHPDAGLRWAACEVSTRGEGAAGALGFDLSALGLDLDDFSLDSF